jgi:ferredoxin-NADP reductase
MIRWVDNFVNAITMYRLVLYGLLVMAGFAVIFGFLGVLPYSGLGLLGSMAVLLTACYVLNVFFSTLFHAPRNAESSLISAMILFFLFLPVTQLSDVWTLLLASVVSMASKYLLAIRKKHIFNPAAITAVILGFNANTSAVWWVGTLVMFPITLVVGLIIVRKIRRFHLFFSFLLVTLLVTFGLTVLNNGNLLRVLKEIVASWPIMFFASVMLTEPLTTPPTKKLQVLYGSLVGILYAVPFQVGPLYSTPEVALVAGNIFSYIVSPKQKLFLRLREKHPLAKDTYEFVFDSPGIRYKAGQYLEWTLQHHADSRGDRRYFTVASSPTEKEIRLGVKISEVASSTFKKKLLSLKSSETLVASSLAGDFTLSDDKNEKLAFIAGGIGVTPFRSMVKYLVDIQEKRSIVLFYSNKTADEIAYKDFFDEAKKSIGLKTVYLLTDITQVPKGWDGKVGRLTDKVIIEELPDYKSRTFYLSGPMAMVNAYKDILEKMGVSRVRMVTDYFPGF